MSKQSYIKPNKLKVFRDLLVRGRYEEILSKSITNLIANNVHKESIKILDFGSGIEPTILQMVRKKLLEKSIKSISHGYDLYDENELKKLNNLNESEFYFNTKSLKTNDETYDVAVVSDVLHHMGIENTKLISEILLSIKKKTKFLIIKDHFQYGFFSNQMIRFMDFFGNLNSNIKTPNKYYSQKQFDKLMESLNLSIKYKILDNRYHPKFLIFFNNPKYHFIYLLE